MMVEVFRTNIEEQSEAVALAALLLLYYPCSNISFDLEDCDRILRIKSLFINPETIENLLAENGYECTALE